MIKFLKVKIRTLYFDHLAAATAKVEEELRTDFIAGQQRDAQTEDTFVVGHPQIRFGFEFNFRILIIKILHMKIQKSNLHVLH